MTARTKLKLAAKLSKRTGPPHIRHLESEFEGEGSDLGAAMQVHHDEAILLQQSQRLSHRHCA